MERSFTSTAAACKGGSKRCDKNRKDRAGCCSNSGQCLAIDGTGASVASFARAPRLAEGSPAYVVERGQRIADAPRSRVSPRLKRARGGRETPTSRVDRGRRQLAPTERTNDRRGTGAASASRAAWSVRRTRRRWPRSAFTVRLSPESGTSLSSVRRFRASRGGSKICFIRAWRSPTQLAALHSCLADCSASCPVDSR